MQHGPIGMLCALMLLADHRSPALIVHGKVLYATHCAACHGAELTGSTNTPALLHAGGSGVDFYLTTGRMPGVVKDVQALHGPPQFTTRDITALDAYVDSKAVEQIPIPHVLIDQHLLARGRSLFEENCQACHGVAGGGATVGGEWTAPPLSLANPTQIGEAIRYGPGVMPRFTAAQISERDLNALATYIGYVKTKQPAYGGFTFDYLGPVAEGMVGLLIGVGALVSFIIFTGTKADD